MGSLAHITICRRPLVRDIHDLGDMGLHFEVNGIDAFLAYVQVRPMLLDRIKETQDKDK